MIRAGSAVKKAFRFASVPVNVRAEGVPPTTTPLPFTAAIAPSAIPSVIFMSVAAGESASENGTPTNRRPPGTSSVKKKPAGAATLGADRGSTTLSTFTVAASSIDLAGIPASVATTVNR